MVMINKLNWIVVILVIDFLIVKKSLNCTVITCCSYILAKLIIQYLLTDTVAIKL